MHAVVEPKKWSSSTGGGTGASGDGAALARGGGMVQNGEDTRFATARSRSEAERPATHLLDAIAVGDDRNGWGAARRWLCHRRNQTGGEG